MIYTCPYLGLILQQQIWSSVEGHNYAIFLLFNAKCIISTLWPNIYSYVPGMFFLFFLMQVRQTFSKVTDVTFNFNVVFSAASKLKVTCVTLEKLLPNYINM